jgi:O-antigen ligase
MPSLVYFVKEILGFGGSAIFSGIFYCIGLVLMLNRTSLRQAYKLNPHIAAVGITFYIFSILYFFIFNSHPPSFTIELLNLCISTMYILLLMRICNESQAYLVWTIFFATLLINLLLIYSISTNPYFTLGARATVQMSSKGNSEYSGNPYVYSKNGLLGFVISLLMIQLKPVLVKNYSFLFRILLHINLWLSLIVVLLTQTRATFLALAIILILYFVFVFKPSKEVFRPTKAGWTFYGIIFLFMNYINNKFQLFDIISGYYNSYAAQIERALLTGSKLGKVADQDLSAMGRVRNIEYFFSEWAHNKYNFVFGYGYRFKYMDVPVLEAFLSFGIIGVILFILLQGTILFYAFKAIKSDSIFQIFLGLIYFHTFISIFTAGRPTDFPYWISYFIFMRFLGVTHDKSLNTN